MTSYNFKSAIDNGWAPHWFGCEKFGSELVDKIEEFQKKNGLKADGFCGPKTFEKLLDERDPENVIVCGLKHIPINHKVILWNDKLKGLKANKGCFRQNYNQREVRTLVVHWDVCRKSKDTIKILNDRKLSCQFLIDADARATIYETHNADHVSFHAGGKSWNNYSVGVEICNPYYLKYQDKKRPRKIVRGAKVHGRTLEDHLDFYPRQIIALKKLIKALNIGYGIPFETPTKKDGSEYGTVYSYAVSNRFNGVIHHYNLLRGKIDAGGLDLVKVLKDLK